MAYKAPVRDLTFILDEVLEIDRFRSQLTLAGYSHVTQVVAPGEYCIRGGLIDPAGVYEAVIRDGKTDIGRTWRIDLGRLR